MPALEELGQYLVDQGLTTAVGTDLFLGQMPTSPDDALAIFQNGGSGPVRTFSSAVGQPKVERPSFTVMVRNKSWRLGRDKARAVWDKLENFGNTVLQGTSASGTTSSMWLHVACDQSEPVPVGADELGRHRFNVNVSVQKTKSLPV